MHDAAMRAPPSGVHAAYFWQTLLQMAWLLLELPPPPQLNAPTMPKTRAAIGTNDAIEIRFDMILSS